MRELIGSIVAAAEANPYVTVVLIVFVAIGLVAAMARKVS